MKLVVTTSFEGLRCPVTLDEYLKQVKWRADKATPGPWFKWFVAKENNTTFSDNEYGVSNNAVPPRVEFVGDIATNLEGTDPGVLRGRCA
jgi:hypothetical protein